MKVFITWSGTRSRAIAKCIRDWLPRVIQSIDPFYSPEHIEKGSAWLAVLMDELAETDVGILCLTPENHTKPWVAFEAGAMNQKVGAGFVPLLFGLDPSSIAGPLANFQGVNFSRSEFLQFLRDLNRRSPSPLNDSVLDDAFDLTWEGLFTEISAVLSSDPSPEQPAPRSQDEIVREILVHVRSMSRRARASDQNMLLSGGRPSLVQFGSVPYH